MRKNLLLEHAPAFKSVLDSGQGCLVEEVPLDGGSFSQKTTSIVLRPGIRVFVEEAVEYRGQDPEVGQVLGVPEGDGWRELHLPAPTEDLLEALEQVESLLGNAIPEAQRDEVAGQDLEGDTAPPPVRRRSTFSVPPPIRSLVRDLTAEALEGRLGPVVGREQETESLLVVLSRRERANAVLVGPPGVGKSAVAHRLALRLAEGQVPEVLSGAHLLELNCGDLMAGASLRGEVEGRVKRVMEACANPRVILFIDEIHNLLDARGDVKVVDILKPALARGGLRVVGACTFQDYRAFETDGTLARRFEKLVVGEPSPEETEEILRGLTPSLEQHHGVRLPPGAIEQAVLLSERFLPNRYQPDKAISLLDEALAKLRMGKQAPASRRSSAELDQELDRAVQSGDFIRARQIHQELMQQKESTP